MVSWLKLGKQMPNTILLYLKVTKKYEKNVETEAVTELMNQTRMHAMNQITLILLTGVFQDIRISSSDPTAA